MNDRQNDDESRNPFAAVEAQASAPVMAEQERAMAEVQAAMVVARKFPRDPKAAMDRILQACSRPGLAEAATYTYPRGATKVTGPSIRLAEVLAQEWGHMQFGVRELSQEPGMSTVEAYAWDLERNVRDSRVFHVEHARYTRSGTQMLTDPRDVYELVANQGSRRKRAAILAIIPADVIDAAEHQCAITARQQIGDVGEAIQKMAEAFEKYGITRDMLSERLGHDLTADATSPQEIVHLRGMWASIRDGMAKPGDFFRPATATAEVEESAWPKLEDGHWIDSAGEIYDADRHAWSSEAERPAVKLDGTYRARRGQA